MYVCGFIAGTDQAEYHCCVVILHADAKTRKWVTAGMRERTFLVLRGNENGEYRSGKYGLLTRSIYWTAVGFNSAARFRYL